jgi:hypothetical protein
MHVLQFLLLIGGVPRDDINDDGDQESIWYNKKMAIRHHIEDQNCCNGPRVVF